MSVLVIILPPACHGNESKIVPKSTPKVEFIDLYIYIKNVFSQDALNTPRLPAEILTAGPWSAN